MNHAEQTPARAAAKVFATGMSLMMCIGAVVAFLGGAAMMLLIVPRYQKVFDDFGTELPLLSSVVITLSRNFFGPFVLLILAIALVAKEFLIKRVSVKLAMNLTALLLSGSAVVTLVLAVWLPLVKLIESTK